MDMKDNSIIANYNHSISINDRKNMLITGVKKIDSFDDQEFLVETVMGYLIIKGDELGLIKLDTVQGNVTIKGLIKNFSYVDELVKKEKEGSIFNRLFK